MAEPDKPSRTIFWKEEKDNDKKWRNYEPNQ